MRRFIVVFIIGLIFWQLTAPRVAAQTDESAWLFAQINALRQSKGIAALVLNARLTAAATGHSAYLANHVWTDPHIEANGSTPESRISAAGYSGERVGENVVGGSSATVQWGYQWWLDSPIHYRNMTAEWTEIGIGIASGPYGRFYTLDFGIPADLVPSVPTAVSQPTGLVRSANIPAASAKVALLLPTRRPTLAPTATPTITLTPSLTFTTHPTFTLTVTTTPAPPTSTAIELAVSPQPSPQPTSGPTIVVLALTASSITYQSAVITAQPAQPSNDGIRSLIPWAIVLQVAVVGGLFIRALFRRGRN